MRNVAEECISVRGPHRGWRRILTQQVTTDEELDACVSSLLPVLSLKETEETWDKIDAALARFQAITKGGATRLGSYVPLVRHIAPALTNSVGPPCRVDTKLTVDPSCFRIGRGSLARRLMCSTRWHRALATSSPCYFPRSCRHFCSSARGQTGSH